MKTGQPSLPSFNDYLAVKKPDIEDVDSFKELLNLFNLDIYHEEPSFYILKGSLKDIRDFRFYWNIQ